jgi:aminotransferase
MSKFTPASRLSAIPDSVFGEITALARARGAVNLSQGFPDFDPPDAITEAAVTAIRSGKNQYAPPWGIAALREGIAAEFQRRYGVTVDPDTEVTVCCGSTEATMAAMLAVIEPGDEVIVFEPFYENYGPDATIAGGIPRYVRLREPEWRVDPDELARAFSDRTKAIVINTPTNPTGKVFSRDELQVIADLCQRWDAVAVSDEIYQHLVHDGLPHVPIASLPGMAERTITISGISKTYSVTGWRIGWAIAPPALSAAIRKLHDYLTVTAPSPLQEAAAFALGLPETYYQAINAEYQRRRDLLLEILARHGFTCFTPRGAYYVMADIGRFGFPDDVAFTNYLIEDVGVATIPGSSFYATPGAGRQLVRFCYAKKEETLREADRRLARLGRVRRKTDTTAVTPSHR